ncbi:hypothetical protein [Rhodocaloribacter sp.]
MLVTLRTYRLAASLMALALIFGGSTPLLQPLCASPYVPHEAHAPTGVSCHGTGDDARAMADHAASTLLPAIPEWAAPDGTNCLACCVLECADDGVFTPAPPASESLSKLLLAPAPSHPADAPARAARATTFSRSDGAAPVPSSALYLRNAVLLR